MADSHTPATEHLWASIEDDIAHRTGGMKVNREGITPRGTEDLLVDGDDDLHLAGGFATPANPSL